MTENKHNLSQPTEITQFSYGQFICLIFVLVALISLTGYIVQYTWNTTLPDIFGIKEITLYQAIAIFILCNILFKQ